MTVRRLPRRSILLGILALLLVAFTPVSPVAAAPAAAPLLLAQPPDNDGDGIDDLLDPDDDNDGIPDEHDPDPFTPNGPEALPTPSPLDPDQDSDGDGIPNIQDPNDDNDDVVDEEDPAPLDPAPVIPTPVPTAPAPTPAPSEPPAAQPAAPVEEPPLVVALPVTGHGPASSHADIASFALLCLLALGIAVVRRSRHCAD